MSDDQQFGGALTGLERITRLEVKLEEAMSLLKETRDDVKELKEIRTEGRGAVRLLKWAAGAFGVFGMGALSHEKIAAYLKWLGS